MNARDDLAAYVGYPPGYRADRFAALIDRFAAELLDAVEAAARAAGRADGLREAAEVAREVAKAMPLAPDPWADRAGWACASVAAPVAALAAAGQAPATCDCGGQTLLTVHTPEACYDPAPQPRRLDTDGRCCHCRRAPAKCDATGCGGRHDPYGSPWSSPVPQPETAPDAVTTLERRLREEPDGQRAVGLHADLIAAVAAARPCTCARSQGLHSPDCARYVPGHDLASPAAALARYREETAPNAGPGTPNLREQYAAAIRAAACQDPECPDTEEDCARKRIQVVVWHFSGVAEVEGTPEMFADAVLAVRDDALTTAQRRAEAAETSAAELRRLERHHRRARDEARAASRSNWEDAGDLRRRAEGAEQRRDEARQQITAALAECDRTMQTPGRDLLGQSVRNAGRRIAAALAPRDGGQEVSR